MRIIYLILAASSFTFGQVGFSAHTESGYVSNIYANYRQIPDYVQHFQGFLNYDFISSAQGLRTFYQGSATLFEKYNVRNYLMHKIGLSYYRYTHQNKAKVNAGLDVDGRLYSDDYKWYEYKQGYFYANIKAIVKPQLYAYVGVNTRIRSYDNLPPYSYQQNVAFVRLGNFFNSGTSVITEFNYMQKSYLNKDASPIESFSDVQTNGDGQSEQCVGLLRIGQALGAKTGTSAQILLRRNLKSSVRYLINDAGYYYSDEELFDDPFGYNAEQFSLTLKRKLPWSLQASIGGSYTEKHYVNRLALDLAGVPFEDVSVRDDQRFVGWLSLSKAWKYSSSLAPVTLTLDISVMKNRSNDLYYNYRTSYFSFGISQDF
ncbi:hypothetical protein JXA70_00130 [candidate division KSB1 bacterium]|nr:hypothetical protein [candidate division KSB1 bacterium]